MHRITGFALGLLLLCGCTRPPCPPREPLATPKPCPDREPLVADPATPEGESAGSPGSPVSSVGGTLPCGVLTTAGYRHTGPVPAGGTLDETNLVVPLASVGPEVKRYSVVNRTGWPMPLSSYGGWWVCVTRGEILADPESASSDSYGLIAIDELAADQSNGERGQE